MRSRNRSTHQAADFPLQREAFLRHLMGFRLGFGVAELVGSGGPFPLGRAAFAIPGPPPPNAPFPLPGPPPPKGPFATSGPAITHLKHDRLAPSDPPERTPKVNSPSPAASSP